MKQKNKKVCKAKNNKNKCLVYKKTHSNLQAAKNHEKALKKRGANIKKRKTAKGTVLEYSFVKTKK